MDVHLAPCSLQNRRYTVRNCLSSLSLRDWCDRNGAGMLVATLSLLVAGWHSRPLTHHLRRPLAIRMNDGPPDSVSAAELATWLRTPPPELEASLPDDASAEEAVEFCMRALQQNDEPCTDTGKWDVCIRAVHTHTGATTARDTAPAAATGDTPDPTPATASALTSTPRRAWIPGSQLGAWRRHGAEPSRRRPSPVPSVDAAVCGLLTMLTRTSRGLPTVRTGHASSLRRRAACSRAPRTVRTRYAHQPQACHTHSVRWHPRSSTAW